MSGWCRQHSSISRPATRRGPRSCSRKRSTRHRPVASGPASSSSAARTPGSTSTGSERCASGQLPRRRATTSLSPGLASTLPGSPSIGAISAALRTTPPSQCGTRRPSLSSRQRPGTGETRPGTRMTRTRSSWRRGAYSHTTTSSSTRPWSRRTEAMSVHPGCHRVSGVDRRARRGRAAAGRARAEGSEARPPVGDRNGRALPRPRPGRQGGWDVPAALEALGPGTTETTSACASPSRSSARCWSKGRLPEGRNGGGPRARRFSRHSRSSAPSARRSGRSVRGRRPREAAAAYVRSRRAHAERATDRRARRRRQDEQGGRRHPGRRRPHRRGRPDPDLPQAGVRSRTELARKLAARAKCYGPAMAQAESDVVGREAELQVLAGFLDRSSALPGAFLLEGEAGIGKTTLWRRGIELASARSYRVLSCSPSGSETQLSFAGLGDLLEDVLEDVLAPLPEPQRRALAVALLLEEPDGPPPDQLAVGRAFLGALRALAHDNHVALAVDDIQWLDRSSALVLEFALRRLREERVAALFGLRSSHGQAALGLERALPEGRLQRLAVRSAQSRRYPSPAERAVRTRALASEAAPAPRALGWQSILRPRAWARVRARDHRARSRRVSPGDTRDARRGEARGSSSQDTYRPARRIGLGAADPRARQPRGRRDREQWLEAALEAHVIELDENRIRFSHPLLSSAVYGTASAAEKRALHRRLAGLVADPEDRARHMALATDGARRRGRS